MSGGICADAILRSILRAGMKADAKRPPVAPDRLRLGLILPTWTTTSVRWSEVVEIAAVAEEVGFDSLWVSDHLLLPSNNAELKRRAGVEFPDDPDVELEGYLECFTTMAALAVAIPRLKIGSFVASTGYRNAGLMAKMAVSIDDISGGRLILGVGSGDSVGAHRTGGPPIMIGTRNPKARMQRLVAQYADIWNGWLGYTDASPESAEKQLSIIDGACVEHGRDPNTLTATTAVRGAMPGSGYTPRPDENPLQGPPRQMADTLRGHAKLGVAEVQVALTMGGPEGVRAFAPVIEELRSKS